MAHVRLGELETEIAKAILNVNADTRTCLEALAYYRPRRSVQGLWVCDFCESVNDFLTALQHKPNCPVLIARRLVGKEE